MDLIERLRTRAMNGMQPASENARSDMLEAAAEIDRLRSALAMRSRGECICVRCGLRQEEPQQDASF